MVKHNRTVKKSRVTVLPQTGEENPGHSTSVIRYAYSGGKHGSEVVFIKWIKPDMYGLEDRSTMVQN